MPNQRLPMRQIREVLRLRYNCGLSHRDAGRACGIGRTAVRDYLHRAKAAGLAWPLPDGLTDEELEARLFANPHLPSSPLRPIPDCEYTHNELCSYKKDVALTLWQLWVEYKEAHPSDGYEYTQFCEYYRRWLGKRDYSMRQEHKAGEKVFVDYATGPSIVNSQTGELIPTVLFVGVWGASNYTYAEASLTEALPNWVQSHVRAFEYFGCCPRVLTPDCLKSGVLKACLYEPEINRTYAELATYYGGVVLPARPRHPKDKAIVENGVLISKRWILAVLRHRTFFSLVELNVAIRELLEVLNTRIMRKLKKSRRQVFEELDRPAALPLPGQPYEYAEWYKAMVGRNYRVDVEEHTYSVPHRLLHDKLDVRLTATTMEAFFKGQRVAAHVRSYIKHGDTVNHEHMPPAHRQYAGWTPERITEWAAQIGPATALLVARIMATRDHPVKAYQSCFGILHSLGRHFGNARLETAACRAVKFNAYSYRSMKNILTRGLDRLPDIQAANAQTLLPFHENIRGKEYYH